MSITAEPRVRFNVQRMVEDAALLGFTKAEWAARAKVSDMTVIRFLRGEQQTPKTFRKLCRALRQPAERYLLREAVA